jgi:hypothetical protein
VAAFVDSADAMVSLGDTVMMVLVQTVAEVLGINVLHLQQTAGRQPNKGGGRQHFTCCKLWFCSHLCHRSGTRGLRVQDCECKQRRDASDVDTSEPAILTARSYFLRHEPLSLSQASCCAACSAVTAAVQLTLLNTTRGQEPYLWSRKAQSLLA